MRSIVQRQLLERAAGALERQRQRIGEIRLGGHALQVHAEVHDGLRDLRAHAGDDAFRAHEPQRGHRLQQVLRDQRVDRRHAGDVEDGDLRAGLDDLLQQGFHDHLGARGIERADHGQREDAIPEFHDRRRQLEHFALLAVDDVFARFLVRLDRVQAERIEQLGGAPHLVGERVGVLAGVGAQRREERLLQREDETRRFVR